MIPLFLEISKPVGDNDVLDITYLGKRTDDNGDRWYTLEISKQVEAAKYYEYKGFGLGGNPDTKISFMQYANGGQVTWKDVTTTLQNNVYSGVLSIGPYNCDLERQDGDQESTIIESANCPKVLTSDSDLS